MYGAPNPGKSNSSLSSGVSTLLGHVCAGSAPGRVETQHVLPLPGDSRARYWLIQAFSELQWHLSQPPTPPFFSPQPSQIWVGATRTDPLALTTQPPPGSPPHCAARQAERCFSRRRACSALSPCCCRLPLPAGMATATSNSLRPSLKQWAFWSIPRLSPWLLKAGEGYRTEGRKLVDGVTWEKFGLGAL